MAERSVSGSPRDVYGSADGRLLASVSLLRSASRLCAKSLSPSIPHYAPGPEGFVESASTVIFWDFCCGLTTGSHRLQPVGCVRQAAPRSPAGSSSAVSLPPRSLTMLSLLAEVSVHGAITVERCADSNAGPGGYVAAIKAAQHGLRVCMILLQSQPAAHLGPVVRRRRA